MIELCSIVSIRVCPKRFQHQYGVLYIRFVGTHQAYDTINAAEV
ncbi:type II toxin-antitoxin system HigB family toxin [Candidatus Poribacteria bacterium]|nr:type II toxin-antitoxin system HigB family toxin [Candidatus Poribacteria bacterium]